MSFRIFQMKVFIFLDTIWSGAQIDGDSKRTAYILVAHVRYQNVGGTPGLPIGREIIFQKFS
jgi:hypothetical protein